MGREFFSRKEAIQDIITSDNTMLVPLVVYVSGLFTSLMVECEFSAILPFYFQHINQTYEKSFGYMTGAK